ncbi:viperin family antiviral radical SAM protein [Myxococcota bacterium]|nr:viperin family antiviral radical SAM protein [Myxococcota bacterium]
MRPIAANYHLLQPCDAACRFCFATFRDVRGRLPLADALRVLDLLRAAGIEKINLAGGEPTLHPRIGDIVAHARRIGFVTSIVTNGSRLGELLDHHAADLDWVGLSVDSADEATEIGIGRGRGDHVRRAVALASRCRTLGIRVKLNTVVCALNWREDLSPLVLAVRPDRWKIFQVLPIAGQNDGAIDDLLVTADQLHAFVERHRDLARRGFPPVVEDNDAMKGSYVMVDPLGRFYGNATGRHVYSDPILDVGVEAALSQVGFDAAKFDRRGGRYAW